MITLGIETSCDETALCLLESEGAFPNLKYKILGNIINSQIEIHKEFGGVFPMLAKREHIKNLPILYKKLLDDSKIDESKIDQIAVTSGPGLEPALWTGIVFAKELSVKLNIPIRPVNHMEGHIVSTFINKTEVSSDFTNIDEIEFPAMAVLISGGHTEIVMTQNIGEYKILGSTVDDSIGEAFDKVARMLNLPYPGGPLISKYAEQARAENIPKSISLPRPMIHSKDLKFSFSGLKTAVLYLLKSITDTGIEINENHRKEISREFEDSVTEVLMRKAEHAIENNEVKMILVGGGVIANKHIRETFTSFANEKSIKIKFPANGLTGDNALMIALACVLNEKIDTIKPSEEGSIENLIARGNLSLD